MLNNRNYKKQSLRAYIYLFPALFIIICFCIYPMIKTFDMSFYNKYNYIKDIVFERGFDNYRYLLKDKEFLVAIKNTFIYVVFVAPISIIISLAIAILINSKIKFKNLFKGIYFLPFLTSTIAISMVFRWIFNYDHGILNYIMGLFNIDPIKWLTDPKWAMTSLIILSVWKSLGYNIIIFLAGLQNIGENYLTASKVDGANFIQRVRYITIPLLSPTLFFVSIITLINSFKVFGEVYALFDKQAGPLNSCLTIVYYVYNKFYNHYQYGIASAAVVILFLIILILNYIQFKVGGKKTNYE